MNNELVEFARQRLKDGLARCTEKQQNNFKLMYSHTDLSKPIDDVVNAMLPERLDWAMQQVERTLAANEKRAG